MSLSTTPLVFTARTLRSTAHNWRSAALGDEIAPHDNRALDLVAGQGQYGTTIALGIARRSARRRSRVAGGAVTERAARATSMLLWFVKGQFFCVSEVLAGQGWATPVGRAGSY